MSNLKKKIDKKVNFEFNSRAGSTFAFSGSGRVGPRPVCGVKARAGSGFEYSSSGRVGPSPNYEVKALSFDWVNGMKLVIPFFQPKFDALKLLVKRCWRISALWRFWLLGCLCSWSSGGLGLWTFELGPSRAWARSKNFGLEHSKKLEKRLGSGSGRARAQARSSPSGYPSFSWSSQSQTIVKPKRNIQTLENSTLPNWPKRIFFKARAVAAHASHL